MAATPRVHPDRSTFPAQFRAVGLACVLTSLLLSACGKREPPAAPKSTPEQVGTTLPTPTLPLAPPPPPDLGMAMESFVSARLLDLCAQKYGESHEKGERLAAGLLQGRKPVVNLDLALPPDLVKPGKPGKKQKGHELATLPGTISPTEPAETPEDLAARERYLKAVTLAEAHTPTQQRVAAQVEQCLYAPELGLIEQALIDRYITVFVEIACLQREMLGPDGKLDVTAHSLAAAKAFTANQFNAGDFARMGLVFGRFPVIQAQLQSQKTKRCPDPRVAEQQATSTGEWNGALTGDRNASLHLTAQAGALTGAVQWLGVKKSDDGRPGTQPAIPVTGALSGETINLFGQVGQDWVRLSGKLQAGPKGQLTGTWQGEVDFHKLKGAWSGERVPAVPALTAPVAATPVAP